MSSQNDVNASLKDLDGMYSKQDDDIHIICSKPKWKSKVGGTLLIFAVGLSFLMLDDYGYTTRLIFICNPFAFFVQIVAIIGGISAISQKKWIISIVGGIFGLFLGGPYFIATVTSALALIILLTAGNEFMDE